MGKRGITCVCTQSLCTYRIMNGKSPCAENLGWQISSSEQANLQIQDLWIGPDVQTILSDNYYKICEAQNQPWPQGCQGSNRTARKKLRCQGEGTGIRGSWVWPKQMVREHTPSEWVGQEMGLNGHKPRIVKLLGLWTLFDEQIRAKKGEVKSDFFWWQTLKNGLKQNWRITKPMYAGEEIQRYPLFPLVST